MAFVFVAPMVLIYEGGQLFLGTGAMRNGADVWLREFLASAGFTQYFLLPCLTCAILIGWHHLNKEKWKIAWTALYGMLVEVMLLGLLLLFLAKTITGLLATAAVDSSPTLALQGAHAYGHIVSFLGAGIYEELLFRLMLFPALAALLRFAGTPNRTSWALAILLSSVLFAAAHYQLDLMIGNYHLTTTVGDSFEWGSFLFRTSAGAFFASLFLARGFGVAAGTHACYDILVSMS